MRAGCIDSLSKFSLPFVPARGTPRRSRRGDPVAGPSPWPWIHAFAGMSGALCAGGVSASNRDTPRLRACLSARVRSHYRELMSDLAPAASPTIVAAASARRGESRWWVVARTAFPFLGVALAWELTAHLGVFPRKLFPPLEE